MKDRHMLFCIVIQCMDMCTQTWPTIYSQTLLKGSAQVTPQRSPAAEPSDAAAVARDDEGRAGHAWTKCSKCGRSLRKGNSNGEDLRLFSIGQFALIYYFKYGFYGLGYNAVEHFARTYLAYSKH